MLRNNADARRCSYFGLGLPVIIHENAPWSSAAKSMLPENEKCFMTSLADTKHIFRERKPRISQLAKTTRG